MKKYILILFAAASLVWSCAELENDSRVTSPTAPSALSNVATSSRIGSVVFTWDNPTSGDYYYTLVEFERGGQTVTHKVSRYAVSPTLGQGHTRYIYEGFDDTKTYTFTLTDAAGNVYKATDYLVQRDRAVVREVYTLKAI